jgi:hypothetical protein
MATIAIEHDVCVEMEVDGTIVRVMPSGKHRVVKRELTREEKAEEAWAEWERTKAKRTRT